MSLIFSAADMLPKIRLFEYQEESMKGETIAAISTAVSSSGIGIVRISGDQAFEIADRVYRSTKGKKKLSEQQSHTVHYGYICDGDEVLDEVLVVLMRARTTDIHRRRYHRNRLPRRCVCDTASAGSCDQKWCSSGRAGRIYQTCLFKWKNGSVAGGGGDGCH